MLYNGQKNSTNHITFSIFILLCCDASFYKIDQTDHGWVGGHFLDL